MSVSSHHAGGVHVALLDGNIRFILDSIEAGDPTAPSVAIPEGFARPRSISPYGLWGALGTRASRERVDLESNDAIVAPVRELSAEEKAELQAKPLEKWTLAAGDTLQARQIGIDKRSILLLMTEAEDVKRIKLSDLKSEDAFRAVERETKEILRAHKELISTLEKAVETLNNERIVTFLDQYVLLDGNDGATKQQLAKMIDAQRGNFIRMLEQTVNNIPDVRRIRTFNLRGRTKLPGGLQVQYIDGSWRIVLY